jgi:hypothetical protein
LFDLCGIGLHRVELAAQKFEFNIPADNLVEKIDESASDCVEVHRPWLQHLPAREGQ